MALRAPIVERRVQTLGGLRQPGTASQTSAQEMGGNVGQSVERNAQLVQGIVDDARAKADKVRILDAKRQVQELTLEQEKALVQTQGKNALEQGPQISKAYQQGIENITKGMRPRQVAAIHEYLDGQVAGMQGRINRHTGKAQVELAETSYRSGQELSDQRAISAADAGDMASILAARQAKVDAVAEISDVRGLDADSRKALELEATTSLHAGVLQAMATNDQWEEAKDYLKAHQDEIDAKKIGKVRAAIDSAGVRRQALAQSDTLITQHTPEGSEFEFDLGAYLADVRASTKDPELRDELTQRGVAHQRQLNASQAANDEPRMGRIRERIARGLGVNRNSTDFKELSPKGRAMVLSTLRARRNEGRRVQNERDRLLRDRFRAAFLNNYDALVDANLDNHELTAGMSPGELAASKLFQAGERRRGGVARTDFDRTLEQRIEASNLTNAQKKAAKSVVRGAAAQWALNQKDPKARPPAETANQWLANAFGTVTKPGLLWGSNDSFGFEEGVDHILHAHERAIEEEGGGPVVEPPRPPAPERDPAGQRGVGAAARSANIVDDIPSKNLAYLKKLMPNASDADLVRAHNNAVRKQQAR